jgi:hypothetical protein
MTLAFKKFSVGLNKFLISLPSIVIGLLSSQATHSKWLPNIFFTGLQQVLSIAALLYLSNFEFILLALWPMRICVLHS